MKRPHLYWALFCAILGFCLILFSRGSLAAGVREVKISGDAVIPIRTAPGFSTILEFSSKPISAVLGDQDAFKLEYVGNSITIKPIVERAKSNLFIFTEFDRYNCKLSTVPQRDVDYIVRIKAKREQTPIGENPGEAGVRSPAIETISIPIRRSGTYSGFTFSVDRITRDRRSGNPRSAAVIDFTLSSTRKYYAFSPGSLGVKQSGKYLAAESIYLDQLFVAPGSKVHGKIALLSQDYAANFPLAIVFAVPALKPTRKTHVYRIEVVARAVSKK